MCPELERKEVKENITHILRSLRDCYRNKQNNPKFRMWSPDPLIHIDTPNPSPVKWK